MFGGGWRRFRTAPRSLLLLIPLFHAILDGHCAGSYEYLPYASLTIDAGGDTQSEAPSRAEAIVIPTNDEDLRPHRQSRDSQNSNSINNNNNNSNSNSSNSAQHGQRFHSRLGSRSQKRSVAALSLVEEASESKAAPTENDAKGNQQGLHPSADSAKTAEEPTKGQSHKDTDAQGQGKSSQKQKGNNDNSNSNNNNNKPDENKPDAGGDSNADAANEDAADKEKNSSNNNNNDNNIKNNNSNINNNNTNENDEESEPQHGRRSLEHGEDKDDDGSSDGPGNGLCAGQAKDIGGGSEGHFRLYGRPARMFRVGDSLGMYRNADCSGKEKDMLVTATPMIDKDDVFGGSWSSLNIAVGLAELSRETRYLCGPKEGDDDHLQCIASVKWPMMRFNPSQFLKPLVTCSNSSSPLGYYVRRASAMDDTILDLYEYMILATVIIGVLSIFHAAYVFVTLGPSDGAPPLKGIKTIPIYLRLLFGALQMMTFAFGVNSMVTLSTRIFLADAPVWMIESILGSGALLALLGILRLSQLLFTSQLYEVALLQGKYIVPDAVSFFVGLGDIVVITAFVSCGGLIFFCYLKLKSSPEELSGCISGVLAIIKILHASIEGQKRQQDGLCSIALQPLASAAVADQVSRRESKDEIDLMNHFEAHPNVQIHIGHLCHGVRQGKDPLNELDDPAYEEPQDWDRMWGYNITDIRWHARYIHKKSGSKFTVVSLPLCCCFILMVLTQCAGQRFRCKISTPTLTTLQPSEGVLIPPFDPEIKEYTLLHDGNVEAFSFLNLADTLASRSKEFRLSGTDIKNTSAGNPLVAIDTRTQIAQNQYPYDMLIRVLGAMKDGLPNREEKYSISFSKVSRILATMKMTSGNWSRCVYWGPIRSNVMALPPDRSSVTVEIGTLEYAEGVPISLNAWRRMSRRNTVDSALVSRPTAVFEALPNSTALACRDRCAGETGCMLTHVSATGCFHIMLKVTNETCNILHNTNLVEKVPQSIAQSTSRTEVVASLCPRSTTKWTKCAMQSSFGDSNNRTQRLSFPVVTLEEARYNSFSLILGLKRVDSDSAQPFLERKLGFWKGSPIPEHVLAAPQTGLRFTYTKNPDHSSVTIKFSRYKVSDWGRQFKLLLIPLVEDAGFVLVPPKHGEIWDGKQLDPPLDFGRCETLAATFQTLWVCSRHNHGHNQQYHHPHQHPGRVGRHTGDKPEDLLQDRGLLVTLDPLQPFKTEVLMKLQPREHADLAVFGMSNFTVNFDTADLSPPAAWSIEDSCGIFAPDKNAEYISGLLTNDVILSALHCDKITLEFEESRVELSLAEWLGMALRRSPEEGTLVQLIQALVQSETPILNELLASNAHGIHTVEDEQCVPYLETAWDKVQVAWDTIIRYGTRLDLLICKFGKGSVAPRYVASAILNWAHSEESLLGLLDCIKLPVPLAFSFIGPASPGSYDWHSVQTSPLAAAIKAHNDGALKKMLEQYNSVFASVEVVGKDVAHTRTVLDSPELAAFYGCTQCVPSIVKGVQDLQKLCEDDPMQVGVAACESFAKTVLRLNLGAMDLTAESEITDVVATIEALSASISFEHLDLREALPDRTRLMQLLPIWSKLTKLKSLDISDNDLDSCGVKRVGEQLFEMAFRNPQETKKELCTWARTANVRAVVSDTDSGEKFSDMKAAAKVCTKLGQAFCGQILCETGQAAGCTIHRSSEHSTESMGPVGESHVPSKACFEEQIYDFLSNLVDLEQLTLRGNALCTLGLAKVTSAIAVMPSLKILDMSSTRIGSTSKALLKAIGGEIPRIERLNISFNELGVSGVLALLPQPSLGGEKSFLSLSASRVGIANTDPGFSFFMKHLADYKNLEVLELGDNALAAGIDDFSVALKQLKKLRKLDLTRIGIDVGDLRKLELAPEAKGIEALLLGGNALGDDAIEVIISRLVRVERPIVELDLSNTGLGAKGSEFLKKQISAKKYFTKLRSLQISANSLTDTALAGIIYTGAGTSNANITAWYVSKTLGVWSSGPKQTQRWETLRALGRRKEIEVFDFSGNKAPLSHFRSSFIKEHLIRELYLRGSITSDIEEWDFIGELRYLEILDVSDNALQKTSIQRLFKHAGKAWRLKELVIYGNNFSREDLPDRREADYFQSLHVLKGDFSPCDMQALRLHFPRAEIVGPVKSRNSEM